VVASRVGGAFEHHGTTVELRVAEGHRSNGWRQRSMVRPSADAVASRRNGAFSERTAAR
jgi:hypothetical protein